MKHQAYNVKELTRPALVIFGIIKLHRQQPTLTLLISAKKISISKNVPLVNNEKRFNKIKRVATTQ